MKTFKRLCIALAPLLAFAAFAGSAATVLADDGPKAATQMEMGAPAAADFGEPVRVIAMLRDDSGKPVAKATVGFYSPTTFLAGASGLVLLDRVTTDAEGVAAIEYAPRMPENAHVVARFEGDAQREPSQADMTIAVNGNHQLYEAEAGIRVPFLNKWGLVAIMSTVWGLYFLVVTLILRIAATPN